MKKFLFDLPPRDPARKPYAAGLTPEADAWAKANKHRIGTYRSHWCRPQYSAFVGNVDMLAELCTLYDDWGLIAYANTKGAAVQKLYENLRERKATVEDALRFCWVICKNRKRPQRLLALNRRQTLRGITRM